MSNTTTNTNSLAPTEVQSVTLTSPDVAPGRGYLLVAELSNGSVCLSSTRFPARTVRNLERDAMNFGGLTIQALYVSWPHPRSEKICRILRKKVAEAEQQKRAELEWILREAHSLLKTQPLENTSRRAER
jgi:hypothetical protein